jgi:hypothetical protein
VVGWWGSALGETVIANSTSTRLGTTFSPLQCDYLGLDQRQVFRHLCTLGLHRIRLCSYWNAIEPEPGQFDFSSLDWLLEESHRAGMEIVLTVGMKAPRWPEYHFPDWVKERYDTRGCLEPLDRVGAIADLTLAFIHAVMLHTRQAPNLRYWQVENEPFLQMEITAGRYLSPEFLRREVELVRSLALPDQKILLTNAITLPAAQLRQDDRGFYASLALADAIGINVYTRVPFRNSRFYLQPLPPYWSKLQHWQRQLVATDREAWIAEAQAEPWERGQLVATGKPAYPSASPHRTANLVQRLTTLGYETVLL